MGDMLYMAGGGRVTRLHGPFVSDGEVERVAKFLRDQGEPQYLEDVTASPDDDEGGELDLGGGGGGGGEGGNDLYDQAVAVVTRDRKASTSYIQRRLQIGLQSRRQPDRAHGEGRRRRHGQPRRQARGHRAAPAAFMSAPPSPLWGGSCREATGGGDVRVIRDGWDRTLPHPGLRFARLDPPHRRGGRFIELP